MTVMVIIAGIFISVLWTPTIRTGASWDVWKDALLLFYQIEDIGTRRDLLFHRIGIENFLIWEYNFHNLEEQFHLASNIGEKFKIAKKLDELIDWQDQYLRGIDYINDDEEAEFKLLQANFDLYYNIEPTLSRTGKSAAFINNANTIFSQLQSIAAKRDEIIHMLWKEKFLIREKYYHEQILKLESARSMEEKYKLMRWISNILMRQDNYFKHMGYIGENRYITDEEENIYQQTQHEFEKLYRWELFNILQTSHKG